MITDFNINFTEKEISLIYQKIKDYPWNSIPDLEGWEHGTNKTYLKELCDYWINEFDWQKHEVEINKFQNFISNVNGIDIHFIKEKGTSPNSKPLLLMHGWPGSIFEFLDIIPILTDPNKYGINSDFAFTVIAPSLPGFGLSF